MGAVELVLIGLAVVVVLGVVGFFVARSRRQRQLVAPAPARAPRPTVETRPGVAKDRPETEPALASAEVSAEQPEEPAAIPEPRPEPTTGPEPEPEPELPAEKPRFRDRITKARSALGGVVGSVLGRSKIDAATCDDLEEALLLADVGVGVTTNLLDDLRARVKSESIGSSEELVEALKTDLKKRLISADRSLRFEPGRPNVWLFVGVNGVGKTTTIGKISKQTAAIFINRVVSTQNPKHKAIGSRLE